MAVTMRDIARILGVSQATVSYVLNNKANARISESTKRLILETARRLSYVPNAAARELVSGRSNTIGLFYPRFGEAIATNPWATRVLKGIGDVLMKADYNLLLYAKSGPDEALGISSILDGRASGLIVMAPYIGSRLVQELGEIDFPTVLIGHHELKGQHMVSVDTDSPGGAAEATRHLIALGHRRIAHITGPPMSENAGRRLQGYRHALESAGLEAPPELIIQGDYTQASGRQAVDRLLKLSNPPTALFAANDPMAIGAIERLKELGLHVPEDMAVVGFDDGPLASIVSPPLTTVNQPAEEVGATAARILLQLVDGRLPPERDIVLPTSLMVRASCGARQGCRADSF